MLITITTTTAAVTVDTTTAVTVDIDGVKVTVAPVTPTVAPVVDIEDEDEGDIEDEGEHWFTYGCTCDWCVATARAVRAFVDGFPWTCPRCESTNDCTSTVCEVCDTDITVSHFTA